MHRTLKTIHQHGRSGAVVRVSERQRLQKKTGQGDPSYRLLLRLGGGRRLLGRLLGQRLFFGVSSRREGRAWEERRGGCSGDLDPRWFFLHDPRRDRVGLFEDRPGVGLLFRGDVSARSITSQSFAARRFGAVYRWRVLRPTSRRPGGPQAGKALRATQGLAAAFWAWTAREMLAWAKTPRPQANTATTTYRIRWDFMAMLERNQVRRDSFSSTAIHGSRRQWGRRNFPFHADRMIVTAGNRTSPSCRRKR